MITKVNGRKILFLISCLLLALTSSGCAYFSELTSSAPSEESAPGQQAEFYYDVFEDIPIPKQMTSTREGYTVRGKGDIKLGLQVYSGRVEINSLNKAIEGYMTSDGWTFYSGNSGPKLHAMAFTKGNYLSVVETIDGSMNTEMRIIVFQDVKK